MYDNYVLTNVHIWGENQKKNLQKVTIPKTVPYQRGCTGLLLNYQKIYVNFNVYNG